MKTTVSIDSFDELYLTCTIKQSYLCSTSLEMVQKALDDIHLDAKAVKSKDVLEIVINLGRSSVDLKALKTLDATVLAIVSSVHTFQTEKAAYQGRLNALEKDLYNVLAKDSYEVSESTTSPTEEDSCKRQ